MKTRSAKAKGKRLEAKVSQAYRHYQIDSSARPMPASGAFTHFKSDVWKKDDYGYFDECKNQETVKLWEWWNKTEQQAGSNRVPLLHIGGNFRPILTVMRMEDYMNLRKEIKDLQEIVDGKTRTPH